LDEYLSNNGYEFAGSMNHSDTIEMRYKFHNTIKSLGVSIVNNEIVSSDFYTINIKEAVTFLKTAKGFGFKYIETTSKSDQQIWTKYQKNNYHLYYSKTFYPGEGNAYLLSLSK